MVCFMVPNDILYRNPFPFKLCCLWGVILVCQEKRKGWTSVFLTLFD
jgi:hypothetical protein